MPAGPPQCVFAAFVSPPLLAPPSRHHRQTAQLGLLSKLDRAGVKLSTLGPLLKQADSLGALKLVEGKGEQLLPLINLAVDSAPALLPLAGGVVNGGPTPLLFAAFASLAAAVAVIGLVPDDSVTNIALQTLLAVPLGAIVPGAALVGAGVLSKLK